MIEPKISLSLLVPSAGMLSSQVCDKNTKNYDVQKLVVEENIPIYNKKGKITHYKKSKETITIKTRKQKLVSQHINLTKEAYDYMLKVPTEAKFAKLKKGKSIWSALSVQVRLKHHFDQIAHDLRAVSYSYEILED